MPSPDKALRYDVVDVFTDTPFAGNALAVVHGAEGCSTAALQAIASEFNLSETAFVLPPTQPGADYRLRIFTPLVELPFAGLPSVGAAWVLGRDGVIPRGAVVQECAAGLLSMRVDADGALMTGGEPELGAVLDAAELAGAVGLDQSTVDVEVAAGVAGCGMDFTFLPVRADAVAMAVPDAAELPRRAVGRGLVVLAFDPAAGRAHLRMFRASGGEDPATGAATLALGVWLVDRGLLSGEGESAYVVHQGAELGRPSVLHGTVTAHQGRVTRTTVYGSVVPVARGEIRSP